MDYIVRRKFILIKNDEEIVLHSEDKVCSDIPDAIETLDKLWKSDRAMYRLAVPKVPVDIFCDDWRSDTAYSFRIGKIVIEAELVDAQRYALNIFDVEEQIDETHK